MIFSPYDLFCRQGQEEEMAGWVPPRNKFELDQLTQISDNDHEFEEDLFGAYKDELVVLLNNLEPLLSKDNKTEEEHKTCERLAHDVKGSSNNVGAIGVGAVGKEMEEFAKQRKYAAVLELMPTVRKEFEEMCKIWEEYKATW